MTDGCDEGKFAVVGRWFAMVGHQFVMVAHLFNPLLVVGMNFIPRPLAIGMRSSQWMEVGCPIGMRLWMNQLG